MPTLKRCDDAKTALKSLDRAFASVPGLLITLGIDAEQAEKGTQKAASSVVARYQDMKRQAAKDALDAHQGVIQFTHHRPKITAVIHSPKDTLNQELRCLESGYSLSDFSPP